MHGYNFHDYINDIVLYSNFLFGQFVLLVYFFFPNQGIPKDPVADGSKFGWTPLHLNNNLLSVMGSNLVSVANQIPYDAACTLLNRSVGELSCFQFIATITQIGFAIWQADSLKNTMANCL